MAKRSPKVVLRDAGNYLKQHPEEIVRVVKGAFALRFGVPIDALRYLVREFAQGKKVPRDVVIEAAPPGVRVAATVDAMGTALRVSLVVYVEELNVTTTEIRVAARIGDTRLEVLSEAETPLAGLVKSGALDLSKPGNLVAFMPKRPAALVDAKGDRVVVDLMKVPAIAGSPSVRRGLAIVTPVVGIRAIKTKDDHLDVHFRADLAGVPVAIAAARSGS